MISDFLRWPQERLIRRLNELNMSKQLLQIDLNKTNAKVSAINVTVAEITYVLNKKNLEKDNKKAKG